MNILDCSANRFEQISQQLAVVQTFTAALALLHEAHLLENEIQQHVDEVQRLSRGWTYIPTQ
jgi:hypothetical protein